MVRIVSECPTCFNGGFKEIGMLKCLYDASGNRATLGVSVNAPQILGQPVDQISSPGDVATFSVLVADSDAVSFQWQFNGAVMAGATADSLSLPNVSAADEGLYSVIVTNSSGTVNSTPAALLLDSDGDGLPDNWEIANFTNLTSQRSDGDPDHDGVSNLDEFLDGTDPNSNSSFRPRLRAFSGVGGSLTVTPMKLTYDLGETVTLTASASLPSIFVGWTGDVSGSSATVALKMDGNKTIRARFASVAAIPPGLVAAWRGETDARDSAGGQDGAFFSGLTAVAPTITASGKVGGSFDFDGTVHVRVPDSPVLKPQQVSVEAWVFPTVGSGTFQAVIARGSVAVTNDAWVLGLTGRLPQFMWRGNHTVQASVPIPLNEWTHLAGSFGDEIARIYVNGELVSEHSDPGVTLLYDPAPVPMTIGSDWTNNQSSSRFNGRIDEVSLYNRVLTNDEIRSVYAADSQGKNFQQPYFTSSARLPDAASGTPYLQQLSTLFGAIPVSFSLSEGVFPTGINITPAGLISGIPTIIGLFTFTVLATDTAGQVNEQFCILQVI
jgi:Concanavalin A-like lectin/glucanases superfamily/Divergent InlB B-repeat domain/Putative Ig domain/Immunoglobulin I-set domain